MCMYIYIYIMYVFVYIAFTFALIPAKKSAPFLVNPKSPRKPGDISGKPSCWMILTRQLTEGCLQVPEGVGETLLQQGCRS